MKQEIKHEEKQLSDLVKRLLEERNWITLATIEQAALIKFLLESYRDMQIELDSLKEAQRADSDEIAHLNEKVSEHNSDLVWLTSDVSYLKEDIYK